MLSVEFADFGFGTVVGAVVTGFILILLDQRRRKDEKKRLFLEEKRLMYRNTIQAFELLAAQVRYLGMWDARFKDVQEAKELDEEESQFLLETGERAFATLAETQRRWNRDGTDFSILASSSVKRAATAALETIQQMLACIAADEPCDLTVMQVILEEELQNFRYYIRQDLGTNA